MAECLERMYTGSAPTLKDVRDAYGDNAVNGWLAEQIAYMFEHTESTIDQVKTNSLIRLIRAKYPWLKATELMHFVFLFRTGEFGKVYGKADGQTVMLALKDYCRIRENYRDSLASQADDQPYAPRWAGSSQAAESVMAALKQASDQCYGQWRTEPWAETLCKWYFAQALPAIRASQAPVSEEERCFPGNWVQSQRREFATSLGWREG